MPRFAANLMFLFNELPFLERFEAAARAGFAAVEYQFPYTVPAQEIVARLRDTDLQMVLINTPPGNHEAGERGLAALPGRERDFEQAVDEAARYAVALGCTRVNCMLGRPGESSDKVWRTLRRNLGFAAKRFAEDGLSVLIEPLNSRDVPGYAISNSTRACALIDEVAADNLLLQYDLYHMQIMEGDLTRTIESRLSYIGHMQFADNPGRGQPGTGELRFEHLFAQIDRLGYAGWMGAEYTPTGSTQDSLGWFFPWRDKR